jgi:hypothetical protein
VPIIRARKAAITATKPAVTKESRYEPVAVRDTPANSAADAAPIWWLAEIQPNRIGAYLMPNVLLASARVGGTVAIQSRP